MSGTSLDGVDVALLETDGEAIQGFGPTGYRPYTEAERDLLRRALAAGAALTDRTARPGVLAEADEFVTRAQAEAVENFLAKERIDKSTIDVVGFHGQTVLHKPDKRLTVQIGDGPALARRLRPAGGLRFPRRGRGGWRAGRAARAGLSSGAGAHAS